MMLNGSVCQQKPVLVLSFPTSLLIRVGLHSRVENPDLMVFIIFQ